ncbi:hypothetical protein ACWKSP_22090 [Micromonosporaceae bacterium Da 78-11]
MTQRTSNKAFAAALAAKSRAVTAPPIRPVMAVAVDMRLTPADLTRLTPEQIEAVFEGVGHLSAQGLGR